MPRSHTFRPLSSASCLLRRKHQRKHALSPLLPRPHAHALRLSQPLAIGPAAGHLHCMPPSSKHAAPPAASPASLWPCFPQRLASRSWAWTDASGCFPRLAPLLENRALREGRDFVYTDIIDVEQAPHRDPPLFHEPWDRPGEEEAREGGARCHTPSQIIAFI